MRAGRLRRRVTVQQPVSVRDAYGDEVPGWSDVCTRWAGVEPVGGSEFWDTHQETAKQTIRVVLRHDSVTETIEPNWRINYGGKLFDIENVDNVGELDRQLTLTCEWRHLPSIPSVAAATSYTADNTVITADSTAVTADST